MQTLHPLAQDGRTDGRTDGSYQTVRRADGMWEIFHTNEEGKILSTADNKKSAIACVAEMNRQARQPTGTDKFKFVVIVEESSGAFSFYGAKTRVGTHDLFNRAMHGGAKAISVKCMGKQTSRFERAQASTDGDGK